MYCVDDDLFDVLYNLHSICAKVVKDTYEKYKLDICFPIDICKVAEFLNVQISRSDLNRLWPDEFLQYITYIQPYENKKEQHVKRTTINTDFKDYCDTDFYDWHFYSNGELFGLAGNYLDLLLAMVKMLKIHLIFSKDLIAILIVLFFCCIQKV